MLLKTIRKFLKKFHLFGCHRKKNDEFLANQSTGPWLRPHRDEPWWQKVTMSSLNSNWVNISYWQQQQCCGYIFTEPTVTPRQETPSSTRRTGKIWFGQECLETWETGKLLLLTRHEWQVSVWIWYIWETVIIPGAGDVIDTLPGCCATRCNKCALITLGVKLRWR